MRRLGVFLAAAAFAVFAVGAPLLVLEMPFFTAALSARYSLAQEAGLSTDMMGDVAEQARAFVVAGRGTLPGTVDGHPGFDAAAVSHLSDVAAVISGARKLTVVLGVGLAAWVAYTARRRREDLARSLLYAAVALGAGVALALVAALSDFEALFTRFHGLFFADGTWTFPYDSLLIRLFPEPFWVASGASWAAGTALLGGAYLIAWWLLRRRA